MTNVIQLDDSLAFAALSGDFNPMHTDPESARRLMFGRCVVHGVHTLLLTLDHVLAGPIHGLQVWWQEPVFHGDALTFDAKNDGDDIHITAKKKDRVALTLVVTPGPIDGNVTVANTSHAAEAPDDKTFAELGETSGTLPLTLDEDLARRLFPRLATHLPPHQIAMIAATTRVVGMKVPGQHSLYTSLRLDFSEAPTAELSYKVRRARRNLLLSIDVVGGGATGRLETMMRPKPVEQPSFDVVKTRVESDRFRGQRAVVVGGSRGLGEATAKLLAAGGAKVTITYRSGQGDAERVCADIRSGGGDADAVRLNVLDTSTAGAVETPTHLYYFATPFISLDEKVVFDSKQFHRLCAFYVDGLVSTIAWARAGRTSEDPTMTIFYPSSVYVDEPVRGAAAYAAAKMAGEQTCRTLSALDDNLSCQIRRLARTNTDQTSSLLLAAGEDPIAVMLEALKSE